MQFFHQTCPRWRRLLRYGTLKVTPRFWRVAKCQSVGCETYQCDACRTVLHVDVRWNDEDAGVGC